MCQIFCITQYFEILYFLHIFNIIYNELGGFQFFKKVRLKFTPKISVGLDLTSSPPRSRVGLVIYRILQDGLVGLLPIPEKWNLAEISYLQCSCLPHSPHRNDDKWIVCVLINGGIHWIKLNKLLDCMDSTFFFQSLSFLYTETLESTITAFFKNA